MAQDYAAIVRKNNDIVLELEKSGAKRPDMPLKTKYLELTPAKFGGKKRGGGNSGKVGRAGRRQKRLYLAANAGPQWKGPGK